MGQTDTRWLRGACPRAARSADPWARNDEGRSNLEIAALDQPARDPGAVRPGTEVFEAQRVEPAHRLVFEFEPERADHLMSERASRGVLYRILAGFQLAYRAHDIAEADPAALPRQAI